jgi:broad specificity phosphatase PhoE
MIGRQKAGTSRRRSGPGRGPAEGYMQITIIRHGKVKMKWPFFCTSEEFDAACHDYDTGEIERPVRKSVFVKNAKVFVSDLPRSPETAECLFRDMEFHVSEEIREVAMHSFRDSRRRYPIFVWYFLARMQWIFAHSRQPESMRGTLARAQRVVDLCERENCDCILVTHGFFARSLLHVLRKRGYRIEGDRHLLIRNLQEIRAIKI